jgi:hypothetical protein
MCIGWILTSQWDGMTMQGGEKMKRKKMTSGLVNSCSYLTLQKGHAVVNLELGTYKRSKLKKKVG